MDFNYDLSKNLGKEIKVRKQEESIEAEKTKETKKDEPSPNLRIPTSRKITADATAIDATIKQALLKGQTVQPEVTEKEKIERSVTNDNGNNPFVTVTPEEDITVDETANNIFITESIIEQNPVEVTTGGVGSVDDDYGDLVEQWYALPEDADYQRKMNLIGRIILAAQRDGNDVAAGTWTCYRFILHNNNLKERYNNYLQLLAGNEGYENYKNYVNLVMNNEDPGWYEDLEWNEQQWEISTSIMSPEDELDFDYFHRQLHFGGYVENGIYIQPTPEEYPQAYVYCCAMIARYTTKILAIQVKLHDPDIINYPNPNGNPENVLVWKLNQDIAYYRQLLQNMLAEKNRLAVALGYATQEENGAIHFSNTFPNNELTTMFSGHPMVGGLVPGLTPPENNPEIGPGDNYDELFQNLVDEYNNEYGDTPQNGSTPAQIAKAERILIFIQKMLALNIQSSTDWAFQLTYWQGVFEQLQNNG